MRITADIEDTMLADLLEITGDKTKSAAIARAVKDFVFRHKAIDFGKRIMEGAFDYPDPILDESGQDVTNPFPLQHPED